MNKLPLEKRVQILSMLCEGSSMRSIGRVADVSFNTVAKLLHDAGLACATYHDETVRNVTAERVQCDEIWSFCYAKEKNVPRDFKGKFGYGDVWTWTALDADTKLIPSWMIGDRSANTATIFIQDLASRLSNRVQLTTDGHKAYLNAIEEAFTGTPIDYAMLTKIYREPPDGTQKRYSPGVCCGVRMDEIKGYPDANHISTSFVERQNLTMRMSMRRFTRLTNGFSKKVQNLEYAVALHFMHYNFARVHKSLRVTPAMEAGVSDHVWEIEEIVTLIDAGH